MNSTISTGNKLFRAYSTTRLAFTVFLLFATSAFHQAVAQCTVTAGITSASGPLSICEGEAVTLSAASGYYSYNWSNGSTSQSITVSTSGTYDVTVTYGNGCSVSTPLTVIVHHAPMPHVTGNLRICNGAPARPDAGAGYIAYLWSTGDTTQTTVIDSTVAFFVTVVDSFGCVGMAMDSIQETAFLQPVFNGGSVCAATPELNPGSGFQTYQWSTGETTQSINVVVDSTFILTVTNENGCTGVDSFYTPFLPPPFVPISGDPFVCAGGFTDLQTMPGATSYLWSTGETGTRIRVTAPGTYSLSVMSGGCEGYAEIFVESTGSIDASIFGNDIGCPGTTNTLALNDTFDTYAWSTGETDSTIDVTGPGVYSVTVTAGSCKATATKIVFMDAPQISIEVSPASGSASNGALTTTVAGGVEPYTYLWNTGETTQDLIDIPAGNYSITVTGASGCTNALDVVLSSISAPPPSVTFVVTDATCGQSNGVVDLNVTDGTPPYSFIWSNGATTEDLMNVPAGNYSVTVTDADGNNAIDATNVSGATAPSITLNPNDASCGLANGSISSSLSGGAAPFTYLWSNGATTTTVVSLPAGSYSLTVTDANNCTATADTALLDSPSPTATFTVTNEICNNANGSVTTIINNGTPPFTTIWSNDSLTQNIANLSAGDYTLNIFDAEGCSATGTATVVNVPGPSVSLTIVNSTCSDSNGSLLTSVTDGTAPFDYAWSDFTNNADLVNAAAGTYSVTVTDANNCSDTASATIADIPGPALSTTITNTTCGSSNGAVDLMVSGGTAPYVFAWDNGATSEDIANAEGGTYNVSVTDDNGCTATANALVGSSVDVSASLVVTNTSCGLSNGGVVATINTGNPPYNYLWNNGATTASLSNLSAGTYILTVNDASGCNDTQTATVLSSTALSVTANVTNATCGLNNGAVTLTVATGTPSYTYAWSNGTTTQNLIAVAAGTYTVTVADAAGCTATASATVTTSTPPSVTVAASNATCGNANGAANATVTGGVAPFTFAWSNGITTEDLINLNAGTYTVTVTDNIGCSATATTTVSSSAAVSVTAVADNAACGLSNGSVTSTPSGGTAPYTFIWSNGATTQNIANVAAGSYSVTINDANNCTASASATVSNTGSPSLTLAPTPATCGQFNGGVTVTVTGGTAPYTFAWSNGATTQNISGVGAGLYTVSVTDADNCVAVSSTTVTGSNPPVVAVNGATICVGQTATLTATGAANYTWTPSTALSATTGATVTASPTATITYTVTGTDANACTATATSVVIVNTPPAVTVSPTNDTLCLGQSVILLATGGATYTWVPNSGLSATTGASVTATPTVSSTYTVTATNAANCSAQASVAIVVGSSPAATANATPATCNASNGSISLSVSGGTTPYTFVWTNGATTQNISNLAAGNYSVTVTSSQGCSTTASATVTSANAPVVNATASSATCGLNNGAVTALVAGGVAPITYSWSNGATTASIASLAGGFYAVTVSDANGCTDSAGATVSSTPPITVTLTSSATTCDLNNGSVVSSTSGGVPPYTYTWSNGATTANISALAPGTYAVTVTGSLGCTATQSAVVAASTTPSVSAVATDATCGSNNGSIDLTVTGGTAPSTYVWSNGITTQDLSGLSAGSYTVTVTDANNCTASLTTSVSSVGGPTITPTAIDAGCNNANGAVTVGVVGGTPPYTFVWSNGATTQSIANITAGTYSLSVTDDNNCLSVVTVTVGSTQPPTLSGFAINASCGEDNGFIDLSVNGGTAPYTFTWNNGASVEDLANLGQGNYIVTVTDVEGCSATAVFDVQATALPDILFDVTNASCGQSTGFVNASVNGGLAPYLFVWSNGQLTEDLNGVAGGTYTLTVTDDEGCTVAEDVTVDDVPGPQVNGLVTNANCANADGSIDIDITGGAPPYTINWSNGASDEDLVNVIPGTYTVTVLDANFCFTEQTFNVNPGDVPYATYTTTEVLCGLANGAIDVTPGGGLQPYTYAWSNGATTQDVSALPVGLYSFTVTDALGCTFIQSALVTSSDPSPQLTAATDSSSCGNPNGAIDVTVTGGEAPFNYLWSNGATVEDLTGLQAGNYILTITDNNGCQDALLVAVGNISAPSAGAVVTAATCGNANGAINLSVSNGSAPYEFVWSNGATTEDLANINGGPFGVTVSDAGGCSTTLNITVSQTPAVTIGDVTGPSAVTANTTNTYSVTQQPGMIYNWTVSGGSIVSGQGTNVTQIEWSNAGTFDVVAIVTDATTNCSASDTLTVSVITGIDELQTFGEMSVYPNPATDQFAVRFNTVAAVPIEFALYAVDGRLVSHQTVKAKSGLNTIEVNASLLAAGVYIVELRDGDRSRHAKLVLER